MTFRTSLTLAIGAGLLLLVSVGVLSYRQLVREESDQQWVSHTHQVLEKLDSVLALVLELDSAQNRYLLSKQEADYETCLRLATVVEASLHELGTLTSDNPEQQATLSDLTAMMRLRTSLATGNPQAAGAKEIASGDGAALSQQIRGLLLTMRTREERLMGIRLRHADFNTRRMKTILEAGYAISLLLFAIGAYFGYRQIAKSKAFEEKLWRAQQQYQLLFDSNPISIWVYDQNTLQILDVNATAMKHYGYSREEFLRAKISDIQPPGEDQPPMMSPPRLNGGNGKVHEFGLWRHRRKSGEIVEVQVRSFPLSFDGHDARVLAAMDVTEQKRSQDLLKENEARMRQILASIRDYAILSLDANGIVLSAGGGIEQIKGYKEEEIVGRHFSLFYTPEDAAFGKPDAELQAARESGHVEDDGWRVRKDGSHFWANVVVTSIRDQSGRLLGFVKVTRDTTEKRRAQEELVRRTAELEAANKELETFSYSVSHDLRAPLRGIEGFSQALQEDYGSQIDEVGNNYLARIRAAARRMGELIDDLLNLARVTRAEMLRERVDLSGIAGQVAEDLRSQDPERHVDVKIAPGLAAEGDSRLLRVVLTNLLGNAWKFTSKRDGAHIEFGEDRSNGHPSFFVRDNGAGFDPTYATRLFGAFQRLHTVKDFPGTGIGLATVQRIILRHGGTVWAEGAVNHGATIHFTLEHQNDSGGKSAWRTK
ncbi:MAG TPA: PAS domain S-box protein [Dongiaceae bacterium]|nr:PAS domain S-box protein [Dongiaceae bacterium]